MFFAAIDPIQIISALGAAFAIVAGAYATLQSRKTEAKTAGLEEAEQAFNFQSKTLDRADIRISQLEEKEDSFQVEIDRLHSVISDLHNIIIDMTKRHEECEIRLRDTEARLKATEVAVAKMSAKPSRNATKKPPQEI